LSQFLTQTLLLRRLLRWMGDRWLVVFGNTARLLSFLLLALVSSPLLALIPSMFFALGQGTLMPPLQSLTTQMVDDEMRGGVLGIYQSVVSLATIVSTAVAGSFFAITPRVPYWVGFGLSILVYLPIAILLNKTAGRQPTAS
jgi:MFS family permease